MRRKSSTFFKYSVFFGFILMISFFITGTKAEGLNRDIVAGMPKNFPPHFFIDIESGKPIGFGVDVMDAVAKRCSITIKYKVFENWNQTNQAARDGLIDIIPNQGFTSERKTFMDFTPPYETFRINYYIRATSSSLKSLADIENSKVGVVATNKARFILEKKGQYNLIKVYSFEDLVWKLIAGDVDCIAMPEPVMDYLMQKSGFKDRILTLGAPLVEIKRGIAVTKGRKELFQLLQSTMNDFILSQDFKDIYTKWYGQPEPYWTPKRIGIVSAILFGFTICVMAIWRYRFINRINKELEIAVHDRTKKIEESEKRLHTILDQNPFPIAVVDVNDEKILYWSQSAIKTFGHNPSNVSAWYELAYPDPEYREEVIELWKPYIEKALESNRAINAGEYRIVCKDGTTKNCEIHVQFIPGNLIVTLNDITERKQSEESLQKSEASLLDAQRIANIGNWSLDLQTGTVEMSHEMINLIGLKDKNEALNVSNHEKFYTPESWQRFNEAVETARNKGKNYEIEMEFSDKNAKYCNAVARGEAIYGENNKIIGLKGTLQDITERRKAEKNIIRQREKAERYLNLAGVMFIGLDQNGNINLANKKACQILEVPQKEIIGSNWFDNFIPKDIRQDVYSVFQQITDGVIEPIEYYENSVISKTGKAKTISWHNTALRNEDGIIVGLLSSGEDITEKKSLQSKLQQTQKMESIGNLAGGIAHDFNNLLYPIIGFSEMLKEDLPPDSPEHESAQEIFNAGRRGGELVKQILAFSRQSDHKLSPVRFQKILTEVFKLTRSTIPSDIEIYQDIQKDCGLVMAEETQLHQIAMNLITNAYHAVETTGGKISIQLKEIILDNDDLKDSPLQSGQYVMLSVSDNGFGIPREIINNIFEPYFTTKEKGKGTGLGLAVVHGIVKEHNGDIKVYSEVGKGTTFNVYLPLMKKYDESISMEMELNKLTGTERILLVDDEISVVRLEKQMLERLGYKVSARSNSLEALETFNSNPDGYDLVISDMTMPNMTGDQLAKELMAIRPDIPIIICTGFSERINKEQAEANKVKGFLMKPVVKSEMAQMVRKVLDEARVYK